MNALVVLLLLLCKLKNMISCSRSRLRNFGSTVAVPQTALWQTGLSRRLPTQVIVIPHTVMEEVLGGSVCLCGVRAVRAWFGSILRDKQGRTPIIRSLDHCPTTLFSQCAGGS